MTGLSDDRNAAFFLFFHSRRLSISYPKYRIATRKRDLDFSRYDSEDVFFSLSLSLRFGLKHVSTNDVVASVRRRETDMEFRNSEF